MDLSQIKNELANNPSREFLIEILNETEFPNPFFKTLAYTGINTMGDPDIKKLSGIAAVAIQHIENRDTQALNNLLARAGVPGTYRMVINKLLKKYVENNGSL